MYQYGKQTKEMDRQRKQMAKNLKRSLEKQQQTAIKVNTLAEGAAIPEKNNEDE